MQDVLHTRRQWRTTQKIIGQTVEPYGLTCAQFCLLSTLYVRGNMTTTDLAQELDTTLAFVTNTTRQLDDWISYGISEDDGRKRVMNIAKRSRLNAVARAVTKALDSHE